MKKFLLAALMAGVATSAWAADLPTRKAPAAPMPVYVAPVFTWTGFYVGVNGGYGIGSASSSDFGNPSRRLRRRHGRLQLSDGPVRRSAWKATSTGPT